MALKKKLRMKNGIELSYHRIASMHFETNQRIEIVIHSYLDEKARKYEKDFLEGLLHEDESYPYIFYETYEMEYDEEMTIKKAYQWLKENDPNMVGVEDI